jgi:hypothetical protein
MKFGFSLLLITAVTGAAFAQTAAHAAALPAKRTVESAVTRANFFVDHKKEKHARPAHKHGHPHKHAHLKKPPQKKH